MHIAFTFDTNYAPHVPAVVESVLNQHPDRDLSLWFLVPSDLPLDARSRIERQVGGRAAVRFLENHDLDVDALPGTTHEEFAYVGSAGYLRLQLPHVLPAGVERVLYLDCDTLCLGSLAGLFDTDLRGNIVAAVRDPHARRMSDMGGIPGLAEGEVPDPDAPYFNAGVLLIDVAGWLGADVTPRCLDYIWRHAAETRFYEQDALNYALFGKWLQVDTMWNDMRTARQPPATGGDLVAARLIHTIGPTKPWHDAFPRDDRKKLYETYAARARAALAA